MSKKIKILVSSSIFPNNVEITKGIYIYHQVNSLSKTCEVKVIAPVPYFPSWIKSSTYSFFSRVKKVEKIGDLEVYHPRVIFPPKFGRIFYGFFYALSLYLITKRMIKKMKPDIMICFWVYPDGFANVLLSKLLNIPIIIGGRGCDINTSGENRIKKMMIGWALKQSDGVLSVSNAMRLEMKKLNVPEGKIKVIPNGLNNVFKQMNKIDARKTIGLPENLANNKIILFCGRFSYEKGLEYLISAADILNRRNIKFNILMVGDGSEKQELIRLVDSLNLNNIVIFMGQVPHDQIPVYMNACDIFCLPSIREGWPNVVMEALACGLPVVASKVGGVPEILTDDEFGIMVPPGEPFQLADSLERALNRSWDTSKILDAVKDRTWDNVASEIFKEVKRIKNR